MSKIIRLSQGEVTECAFCERDAVYRVVESQILCCPEHVDHTPKRTSAISTAEKARAYLLATRGE